MKRKVREGGGDEDVRGSGRHEDEGLKGARVPCNYSIPPGALHATLID